MSSVLDVDLLSSAKIEDLTEERNSRIIVQKMYNSQLSDWQAKTRVPTVVYSKHSRTPGQSLNINQVMEKIERIIRQAEAQEGKVENAQMVIRYEDPDKVAQTPCVAMSLRRREPGAFGKGAPFQATVHNMRPMFRESIEDIDNPGYRVHTYGYFYDNLVTLTVWAQSNPEANERALWLEGLMFDMAWYLRYCGTNEVLYDGRDKDRTLDLSSTLLHGRVLRYFIRTEHLRTVSEKTLTRIIMNVEQSQVQ